MAMIDGSSSSELADELQEEILKRLPIECLCRCRSVCKEWNTLFTSTRFITSLWANFPLNNQPCLVLSGLNSIDTQNRCWTYCFSTRMWKSSFSLSFLEGMCSEAYCHGSAAGLLLVDRSVPSVFSSWKNPIVCNPVTGRSLMLPSSPSMRLVVTKGILAGDFDGNQQNYKVVVVSEACNGRDKQVERVHHVPRQNVEIYDSSKKSWSLATRIPKNVSIKGASIEGLMMVFSKGYFYCKATCYSGKRDFVGKRGIVGVSLQNESSIFAPLPGLPYEITCHHLVACRSRVLLARCVLEGHKFRILKEVHILKLVKVKVDSDISASWMEIARMPQSMCDEVRRIWPKESYFQFVGVEDYLCFRGRRSMKMAVYSLNENSWSWLPCCHSRVSDVTWIYSFEPRPDMKVI